MKMFHWLFVIVLVLGLAAGCGPKNESQGMMGKGFSTEKLDVTVFGKGDTVKYCPVSGDAIPAGKGYVHTLKDGKKIKLCCVACVADVEKNPAKYTEFLY
jgi:hypothetical protein